MSLPCKIKDAIHVRRFRQLYQHYEFILDSHVRFVRALLESAQPIRDEDAARRWYRQFSHKEDAA